MKNLTLILLIVLPLLAVSQDFTTREGHAKIFSTTVAEDITAHNYKVTSRINTETGELVVSVPVQSFEFKKWLMQRHFNQENFMHSSAFPRITFKGKISNLSDIDWNKEGKYNVIVTGDITIRDVTKTIAEKGIIEVKPDAIVASSKFVVKDIESYNVGKPQSAGKSNNVADDIEVTYKGIYKAQ